ncbi:glutamine amidotransferase [Candidatus Moduliflexota bacterium]
MSGRPSWNHRFLRDALKGDPTVDLVSFIILRTATDAVNVPQDELSLIPFPTQKIFLEELPNFDLVIFENFSHRFYFPMQYLEKVREFIEGGGGFWMLGGPLSFAGGGYGGSPLEEALPISLRGLQPAQGYAAEPFRPVLTPAAGKHPFFGGFAGTVPEDLPLFDGYNLSGPVRPRSVVLAERGGGDRGARPVIVIGRYGQGRTMAVLTDFLWKWNFEMAGRHRGNLLYLTFVRQAVRWSVGDPQFQPVVIHVEDEHLSPGDRLRASVRVLGEDFLPALEPDLRVVLREGGGKDRTLPVQPEGPGLFFVDAEIDSAGTFELEAQVRSGGTVYGRGSAAVESSWPLGEFRKPGLNREAFGRLSRGSSDAVVELGEHDGTSRLLGEKLREAAPLYRVAFEEKKGLGSEWWAFVLVLGFLAAEWAVRKRYGMD